LVNVLSAVSFVGPLLIMVLRMIFKDLTRFACLVVIMELPFVAALFFLESGGGNEAFATFWDTALTFFKILISQGPEISSVTASSSILLSMGTVLLSVLLLNLLISMFSKTYDNIVDNSIQEYLLQKSQLTFAWKRAPRMPPPLALSFAIRDWSMNQLARHVNVPNSNIIKKFFAGWHSKPTEDSPNGRCYEEPVERPPPNFDNFSSIEELFSFDWRENVRKEWEQNSDTAATQNALSEIQGQLQTIQRQLRLFLSSSPEKDQYNSEFLMRESYNNSRRESVGSDVVLGSEI
jgi:hypothetical protein